MGPKRLKHEKPPPQPETESWRALCAWFSRRAGRTQEALADLTGISQQGISAIKRREIRPAEKSARRIAAVIPAAKVTGWRTPAEVAADAAEGERVAEIRRSRRAARSTRPTPEAA
jgi:transcriptional regulator with XRE-family HTH domain